MLFIGGLDEFVDQFGRQCVADAEALLGGGGAHTNEQVGLAGARVADQAERVASAYPIALGDGMYGGGVDVWVGVEIEVAQPFLTWKPGRCDSPQGGSAVPVIAFGQGLAPQGGSWLVEVTNNPAGGWKPIDGSYKPWASIPNPTAGVPGEPLRISDPAKAPTQISGYQGNDGKIYIAADGFDRHQGVTMYRVDPDHITNRDAWQPWTGHEFGNPEQQPVRVSRDNFGELSFREVEGRPVLSGFNGGTGNTEVRVGNAFPSEIFDKGSSTLVAAGGSWGEPDRVPQNYGGYIMPGATLDNMGILVSQWNTTPVNPGIPYTVEQFQVNPNHR